MIKKPMLPPKKGYVEVEIDGKRTYRNVETGELIENEVPRPSAEQRITDLEAQLAESDAVALALYEAQMEQETVIAEHDEAILGIYEMMEG